MKKQCVLEYAVLLIVSVISFTYYGLPFYKGINSDIAIHVYMTQSFSLPADFYYWGQDRLGSFIPAIAHMVHTLTGIKPYWCVSLVEYAVIVAGIALWWRFINSSLSRILLAVFVLLPFYEMSYLLLPAHPYGEQMAVLAVVFVSMKRFTEQPGVFSVLIASVFASIAVWISDFSIVYLALIPPFFADVLRFHFVPIGKAIKNPISQSVVLSLVIFLGCMVLLVLVKLQSQRDISYAEQPFANLDEIKYTLGLLWFYTKNVLTFSSINLFNSIAVYALIPAVIGVLYYSKPTDRWDRYFFWSIPVAFVILVLSRWVAINYVMIKYFIPVIFISALYLARKLSTIQSPFQRQALFALSVIGVVSASLTSITIDHKVYRDTEVANFDIDELKQIEAGNYIGGYWYSYVLGTAHPETIKATPHQRDYVRNPRLAQQVINSDTIMVVMNNWLEQLPDTLIEFNRVFTSTDAVIASGRLRMAAYVNRGLKDKPEGFQLTD
ncbi:MAG: hypothetical protein Kow0075_05470 [Salibacteraceae bacterium]